MDEKTFEFLKLLVERHNKLRNEFDKLEERVKKIESDPLFIYRPFKNQNKRKPTDGV